jgi:hypothetical protein
MLRALTARFALRILDLAARGFLLIARHLRQ